jgi:nucleoid-associated protein YgaU
MTRETKIGLLVGLAFIIIVGILLGDSVRHATDVQPAPLPQAGSNVRTAVVTPGAPAATAAPPISLQAGPQQTQNVSPSQPVPTHDEVTRPGNGGVVVIGPGQGNTQPPQGQVNSAQPQNSAGSGQRGAAVAVDRGNQISIEPPRDENQAIAQPTQSDQTPVVPQNTVARGGNTSNDPRLRAANLHGEELVPLGTRPDGNGTAGNDNRSARTGTGTGTASARGAKSYEAQPGDSLSKIALKFYGSNSKALRDAIVLANPSLKGNPDMILVGHAYTIPAIEGASSAGNAPSAPQPSAPAQREPQQAAAPRTGSPGEYWYTVKENDNLWRIARDQLGDPGAVAVLKELNKDVLKGGDTVRINMKLRLPGKPVASAN